MSEIYKKSECFNGAFIKERYIKCPHTDKKCSWRFRDNMSFDYLRNACYLSGSFNLECPK